jgi:hypothetical protein
LCALDRQDHTLKSTLQSDPQSVFQAGRGWLWGMEQDVHIGHRHVWGGEAPLSLSRGSRRRHLYIIGQTATGKSTLLRNLIAQAIAVGAGCTLIDPHGDLALEVMDCVPGKRIDDVIVVDPSDTGHPVGFNPLYRVSPDERALVAANLTAAFKHIWRDSWGPRLEYILFNTIAALLDAPDALRPSFIAIPLLLVERSYREAVIRHVRDPRVRSFFVDEFARWNDRQLEERLGSVQNKIGQFLANPFVRNIFGQWKPSVDLSDVLANNRILIVRLAKGMVGEEPANLLGSFIATGLQHAAMQRAVLPEAQRPDFHLHIDEFHNFTTDAFAGVLSEARKYGLTLTIAHQYLAQLSSEVAHAVFGNVGSIISFRVSSSDAERLAAEIGALHPRNFCDLEVGEVCVRLLQGRNIALSCRGRTDPELATGNGKGETVRAQSRQRYGRPRATVERHISRWLRRRPLE